MATFHDDSFFHWSYHILFSAIADNCSIKSKTVRYIQRLQNLGLAEYSAGFIFSKFKSNNQQNTNV
jgi:hypothetical protein